MKKQEVKELDKLSCELAKLVYGAKCDICQREDTLNVHHIYSRSNKSVRWSINNLIVLCASHHALGNFSAHKAPLDFMEYLKERRGETWYKVLQIQANTVVKNDYKLLKLYLQQEINRYKN